MRINQIFTDADQSGVEQLLLALKSNCCDFINESRGQPVFKQLPTNYDLFQKVKVRKHKRDDQFISRFNEAFQDEVRDLRQRSVFASGEAPAPTQEHNVYYIFPKNGYKYMYCTEVQHSTDDYKSVFESIFDNVEAPEDVIRDLLKFAYIREDLFEGIQSKAELIFYNIPFYYAVRTDFYSYGDLLTDINEL